MEENSSEEAMSIGGYEWGYTCLKCDTFHGLSGMWGEGDATVNGETVVRTGSIESGDTLTCSECGYSYTL